MKGGLVTFMYRLMHNLKYIGMGVPLDEPSKLP